MPDIVAHRLHNQRLDRSGFPGVVEVVEAFGAMQAQDYAGAKWSIGLRVPGLTDAEIDRAFDEGQILRTHVMRPTWHFVAPSTIRWLLDLTSPRVHAACASQYRALRIDAALRRRSHVIVARALRGGRALTRTELGAVLERAGVSTDARRLAYLMMAAELDAVICSGPRKGRQFTYALLEERVPRARSVGVDRALAELARRYFTTHGPATPRDFAWWSGVTTATARRAIEMLGASLARETVGSLSYWRAADGTPPHRLRGSVHLLPAYDEYVVAYRDREAVPYRWAAAMPGSAAFMNPLALDGRLVGTWRRTLKRNSLALEIAANIPHSRTRGLRSAAERYADFLGIPVTVITR